MRRPHPVLRLLACLAIPLQLAASPPPPALRLAVVQFDAVGVEPAMASVIADLLTNLIDRDGVELIERGQIRRVIEERSFAQSDLAQPGTAGQIGAAVNSDCLLMGSVYRIDGMYVVAARLVDSGSGVIRRDARGSVQFRTVDDMEGQLKELMRGMGLRAQPPANPPVPSSPGTVQDLLERPGGFSSGVRMRLIPDRRIVEVGSKLETEVVADRDGFLTLIVVDATGQPGLILPNAHTPQVRVQRGVPLRIPSDPSFVLRVRPPLGTTLLKAVVTDRPIPVPPGADPAKTILELTLQDRLDPSGATKDPSRWGSSELEFLVAELGGQPPDAPAGQPPGPRPPAAALDDPASAIRGAMEDVQRNRRDRDEAARALLRWPLERPQPWRRDWAEPPSIGWRSPAVEEVPLIGVVDADFDPDDPVLAEAFASIDPASRERLREESRRNGDPGMRHGNRVASLIAGRAPWLPAAVPGARILPLRATTSMNGPEWRLDRGDRDSVLAAIRRGMDAGCRVINLSLSVPLADSDRDAFVADPLWSELERRGVILVCAAGNRSEDLDSTSAPLPASLPRSNVLCVAACDLAGRPASWPGGGTATGALTVDLMAPGTMLAVSDGGGRPVLAEGSSYAAALATGTVAAWQSRFPSDSPGALIERMVAASRDNPSRGLACRGGLLQWPADPVASAD